MTKIVEGTLPNLDRIQRVIVVALIIAVAAGALLFVTGISSRAHMIHMATLQPVIKMHNSVQVNE